MKVKFYLKNPKENKSSIRAEFYFRGKRIRITPSISVLTKFWSKKNMRTIGGAKYIDGAVINKSLEYTERCIKDVAGSFLTKNEYPTSVDFVAAYNKVINKDSETVYLVNYIDEKIEHYKNTGTRKKESITRYKTVSNLLKRYQEDFKNELRFEDINMDFYNGFTIWFNQQVPENATEEDIRNNRRYTKNYFATIIKNIKKFMNDAMHEEPPLHDFTGHKHRDFIVRPEDADTIYLSIEELNKICDLEITNETVSEEWPKLLTGKNNNGLLYKVQSLNLVRDRFIIGAFSLLRVSDYKTLDESSFQDGFIKVRPTKKASSGKKNDFVVIPMHSRIKEIIDRGFDFSKTVSDVKINLHIKEIGQLAKIDEEIIHTRNEGGIDKPKKFKKYELITTHTARRSAATNMLLAGLEVSSIMALGGWRTEASFWKYIRMDAEIHARTMANHAFFK